MKSTLHVIFFFQRHKLLSQVLQITIGTIHSVPQFTEFLHEQGFEIQTIPVASCYLKIAIKTAITCAHLLDNQLSTPSL